MTECGASNDAPYLLTVLGDYRVAKGKILNFNIPEYDILGKYLIEKAKHKIDNRKEEIDIDIKKTEK